MKIVDLKASHIPAAVKLVNRSMDHDEPGSESPAGSFLASLLVKRSKWAGTLLSDPLCKYIERTECVDPKRVLDYKIALDEKNKVIGVCGIYSVKEGYLAKLDMNPSPEQKQALESPKNFWTGWLASDSNVRGKGIGKELMKACVLQAVHIACKEGNPDVEFLANSDHVATGFYEKCGMHSKQLHGPKGEKSEGTVIYGAPLRDVAQALGLTQAVNMLDRASLNTGRDQQRPR